MMMGKEHPSLTTRPLGFNTRTEIGHDLDVFCRARGVEVESLAREIRVSLETMEAMLNGTAAFGIYERHLSEIIRHLEMGGVDGGGYTQTWARLGDAKRRELGPKN